MDFAELFARETFRKNPLCMLEGALKALGYKTEFQGGGNKVFVTSKCMGF